MDALKGLRALGLAVAVLAVTGSGAWAAMPDTEVKLDRNPKAGETFNVTVRLTSRETANYTVVLAPRSDFTFVDLFSGNRTLRVENGTTADFTYELQASDTIKDGSYLMTYTVFRDAEMVKVKSFTVKVGKGNNCPSLFLLFPILGTALGLAGARRWGGRPGRRTGGPPGPPRSAG